MRTISEMYKRSGGTSWTHECSECTYYFVGKKQNVCALHPERAAWKGGFVACKFFEPKGKKNKSKQMSIFELI